MAEQNLGDRRRVIGFRVVDDDIVEWATCQNVIDRLEENGGNALIDAVEKDGFLIE